MVFSSPNLVLWVIDTNGEQSPLSSVTQLPGKFTQLCFFLGNHEAQKLFAGDLNVDVSRERLQNSC